MHEHTVSRGLCVDSKPFVKQPTLGGVAEWLCSGLQSRLCRFDSDPRLQHPCSSPC
uniref:Uncharacterized protein n=1 Tax=mine drainage metagenome TaxID=410659 RepID=E6PS67_9ZZZZ